MPLCFGNSMAGSVLSRSTTLLCRSSVNTSQLLLKRRKRPSHCRAKADHKLGEVRGWIRKLPQIGSTHRDSRDGRPFSDDLNILDDATDGSGTTTPAVATGSIFGAVALITGSSVGAGILALPAITAPTGFLPSATIMGASWAFLLLEALLLAEVNVELMRRREPDELLHSHVLSLRTMADETMGSFGGLVTTVVYLMLSYTLLVAYISKSGEVLSLLLDLPKGDADVMFTFGFGGLLGVGGARVADSVNQVLTIMLVGLFLLIVFGGASMANWTGLEHMDWAVAPKTLPIVLLALVYHDLMPVVCAQLGGDIGRIRISVLLGSLVPLAMLMSWDAVALCLTPVLSGAKDPIDVFMRVGGPGPAFLVESFALLAVATSFIGTVLGLSEFLLEQLGNAQGMMMKRLSIQAPHEWLSSNGPARALSFLLVLAPPLVASSLVSDAFFSASDLAGAYGMTSLYGVIPPIMAWSLLRDSGEETRESSKMSLPGGKIALATTAACAVAVIVVQVVDDLPQFSSSVMVAKGEEENHPKSPSNIVTQQFITLAAPSQ